MPPAEQTWPTEQGQAGWPCTGQAGGWGEPRSGELPEAQGWRKKPQMAKWQSISPVSRALLERVLVTGALRNPQEHSGESEGPA